MGNIETSETNLSLIVTRRRLLLRIALVAAVAAALAFFALRTSPYLQYIPWMPRVIGVWADSNGIVRNVAAFFVLGLATYLLVGRRLPHVLVLSGFGVALEVSQIWIRGRVFDWLDIWASLAGIALAWPVAWLLVRVFSRRPC